MYANGLKTMLDAMIAMQTIVSTTNCCVCVCVCMYVYTVPSQAHVWTLPPPLLRCGAVCFGREFGTTRSVHAVATITSGIQQGEGGRRWGWGLGVGGPRTGLSHMHIRKHDVCSCVCMYVCMYIHPNKP